MNSVKLRYRIQKRRWRVRSLSCAFLRSQQLDTAQLGHLTTLKKCKISTAIQPLRQQTLVYNSLWKHLGQNPRWKSRQRRSWYFLLSPTLSAYWCGSKTATSPTSNTRGLSKDRLKQENPSLQVHSTPSQFLKHKAWPNLRIKGPANLPKVLSSRSKFPVHHIPLACRARAARRLAPGRYRRPKVCLCWAYLL